MKYLVPLIVILLASFSYAGDVAVPAAEKKIKCPVCGMFVAPYADWNAAIEFADSTRAIFDGSKDMFKYYLDIKKYDPSNAGKKVAAIFVKDYYSREDTDAFKAYYVIWSDVYGPMGNEPIPFTTEPDAKRFLQEHHAKKVLRFNDINLKLLYELDNPE